MIQKVEWADAIDTANAGHSRKPFGKAQAVAGL